MRAHTGARDVTEPDLDGTDLRVAIVVARFNSHVTTRLLRGAREALRQLGVADHDVSLTWVPGPAFEIPLAAQTLARCGGVDDEVPGGRNAGTDAAPAIEMATWLQTMR